MNKLQKIKSAFELQSALIFKQLPRDCQEVLALEKALKPYQLVRFEELYFLPQIFNRKGDLYDAYKETNIIFFNRVTSNSNPDDEWEMATRGDWLTDIAFSADMPETFESLKEINGLENMSEEDAIDELITIDKLGWERGYYTFHTFLKYHSDDKHNQTDPEEISFILYNKETGNFETIDNRNFLNKNAFTIGASKVLCNFLNYEGYYENHKEVKRLLIEALKDHDIF